jgi:hypothetical protein
MTDQAISPLRRRMIESLPPAKAGDMTIRKLAPKTQHDCVQRVKPGADLPPTWRCRNVAMVSKHTGRKMREGKYHAG